MATAIPLEPTTIAALDAVVANGRFSSRDEAIRTALHIVEEVDSAHDAPLTDAEIAGIRRGLADAEAGRVYPAEEVFEELLRELRAKL